MCKGTNALKDTKSVFLGIDSFCTFGKRNFTIRFSEFKFQYSTSFLKQKKFTPQPEVQNVRLHFAVSDD